jgi:hypothetical protein
MTEETTGDLIADATETTETATDTTGADQTTLAEAAQGAEGEDKNAADLLSDDESGGSEGVPEQYTFEPPEGLELDEDTKGRIDAFADTAREMGLTQQQYQSLIEFDINRAQQLNEAAVESWNGRVEDWRKSAQTDKEIGGEQFKENLAVAESALKQFGDADLRALMRSPTPDNPDGMAIGNHPAVLRFLNRVGKAIADPSLITGEKQPPIKRPEERMYPSMFDKSA